jgi:hypothetical protein
MSFIHKEIFCINKSTFPTSKSWIHGKQVSNIPLLLLCVQLPAVSPSNIKHDITFGIFMEAVVQLMITFQICTLLLLTYCLHLQADLTVPSGYWNEMVEQVCQLIKKGLMEFDQSQLPKGQEGIYEQWMMLLEHITLLLTSWLWSKWQHFSEKG